MKKLLIPLLIILAAAAGFNFTRPVKPAPGYSLHAPIVLVNKHYVTIQGDSINGGHASCIKLINCDHVEIVNCKLMNTDRDTAMGVDIRNCTDVQIHNNFISHVATGVYVSTGRRIQTYQNDFLNMNSTTGCYVQYNSVSGGGSFITKNKMEQLTGNIQDGIDLHSCNALAYSPIWVTLNYIRGHGVSKTGAGIRLGDSGGVGQVAERNILVNPGTHGIYVAGGSAIQVLGNKVYSKQIAHVSYAGIKGTGYTVAPVIKNNLIKWRDSSNVERDTTHQVGKPAPIGWSTNTVNAAIDSTILPVQLLKPSNHLGF